MNYNYLLYFSVLAQTEHYTTAAARLGISQPALSSAIHNLENSLGGVKLFEKVGRNIRLTEEGRFFREKVEGALQELHDATVTLRDSKTKAPIVIRMGVVSGMLEGAVAGELLDCIGKNPRIRFHIKESSSEELMDMVRQEKLDMALVDTSSRDRSLHFRKLCQKDFFVALHVEHPLADSPYLEPHALSEEPQVVFNYDVTNSFDQWASGIRTEESVVCVVNTAQAALELVAAGVGIAVVPEGCRREMEGVCYVPLRNWHQALYMCILYDKWLEPPIWSFVEQLVRAVRKKEK